MRALIVANLAGFASFLINDIKLLQSMGFIVAYAANANKLKWKDTKEKLDELGVEFFQIDFDSKNPFAKTNINAFKQIRAIINSREYNLVHCHTPIAGLITRLAASYCRMKHNYKMKIIYTTHGFAFNTYSSKKSWLIYYTVEKFGSLFCDAMITINHEDYKIAQKMFCKKVYYINGVGVDVEKYKHIKVNRKEYRKSIGVKENQLMILSVGELSERKNHQVIIDAIATIKDIDIVYVICGNGINGGTHDLLEKKALEKNVKLLLLGFRFDIPEITAISDIGAIPSIREGLGLAGIQSLAAGIPLIGTNVQGIKDYIIDGKTGYIYQANDIEGFANGIRLLADKQERAKMRESCINIAENYSIHITQNQMKEIYINILEKLRG